MHKRTREDKKDKVVSKISFFILMALSLEVLIYIVILNIVPTFINVDVSTMEEYASMKYNSNALIDEESMNGAIINPFYKTDRYYLSNGWFKSSVDNPTWLIYYYNMILLALSIFLILFHFVGILESSKSGSMTKRIKSFFKKEWPFLILVIFMFWVFISSLLARDKYRSFIGCYNLKDGFFSFLMYGSILVCSLLLGNDSQRYKKILINTFLISATIMAVLTIWNYNYLNSNKSDPLTYVYFSKDAFDEGHKLSSNDIYGTSLITYSEDPANSAFTIGELLFGNGGLPRGKNFLIVTKRVLAEDNSGIFHNSNHYGYYLSISVILAAVMALKANNTKKSILYLVAYSIMTYMVIINNTFGAYLGVMASLIFMIIYLIINKSKLKNLDSKNIYLNELIIGTLIVAVFIVLSFVTTDTNNNNIVKQNFTVTTNDLKILFASKEPSNSSSVSSEPTSSSNNNVAEIGSGRGKLWKNGLKLALQKPFFGYGLENIIYEYGEQFNISEGRSHNLIIQLSATTGIIGMLLYVTGIGAIWIRNLKNIKYWDVYKCAGMFIMVSYLVSSLFGNSGFYTSPYFYIFVGFVTLNTEKLGVKNNEDKEKTRR